MDFRQMIAEPAIQQEFLERFDELVDFAQAELGGLEGLEGRMSLDHARAAAHRMSEGTWHSQEPGLEAIIRRFTRPVYIVQEGSFTRPPDHFPESRELAHRLEAGRGGLEVAIASTGRVDLRNHRYNWVGTGWMIAPQVVATARHVAQEFAGPSRGGGFAYRVNYDGRVIRAYMDWRHEYLRPAESRFLVEKILWMEPDGATDVALLQIAERGEAHEAAPPSINLMSTEEIRSAGIGRWIAVIGYPALDSRNDAADQQRLFDGVYNVKRLAPGRITAISGNAILNHDATTLGGNSGSAVVDVRTGKAVALHFEGWEGDRNVGILSPVIAHIMDKHLPGVR